MVLSFPSPCTFSNSLPKEELNFLTLKIMYRQGIHIYVVVNFLSQVIFVFLLFLGMVMYAK